MNVNILIDAIVRQTMVLIAQLATASGNRATLAHVANQVFLDLVGELKQQGVGQKIIADMFGLALRTYHGKVRRLSESATDRGRSLWEVVLEFIQTEEFVGRARVLERFRYDDEMTVRGVLKDLVDSGLIFRTGRGDRTAYRAASEQEIDELSTVDPDDARANLVWVAINGSGAITGAELVQALCMPEVELSTALTTLVDGGRIRKTDDDTYVCDLCIIPFGDEAGWEAALFDHYQALVTAICTKLDRSRSQALPADVIGGSTYGFDVWPGHPHRDAVLELLATTRTAVSELRATVDHHNSTVSPPPEGADRVTFYVGQNVRLNEEPRV